MIERLKDRASDIYLRTDWQIVTVLVVIGAFATGMFFIVVSIGEYRMNR